MRINTLFSPNFNKTKRSAKSIKFIIIHYTGMQSERESAKRLTNSKSKVSCHLLINRKGEAYRLVKDKNIAWHAGISCWGKYKNLNTNSIGIELVNKGHRYGYTNFHKKQILTLIKICKKLIKKYKIKKNNIIGHSDIAPFRKIDPGEKFPWRELAKNKIGIWHNCNLQQLKNSRKIKVLSKKKKVRFFKNLEKIGYCVVGNKKMFFSKIIKAFQRHYRKELVNGLLDYETVEIAQNLSKKF
jgi:N-acetylmuramoyl-L-alanine amidase